MGKRHCFIRRCIRNSGSSKDKSAFSIERTCNQKKQGKCPHDLKKRKPKYKEQIKDKIRGLDKLEGK